MINAVKNRIDIGQELMRVLDFSYEICILDKSIDELEGKPLEKLVKSLIEKKGFKVIKTKKNKPVDLLIFEESGKFMVATQDKLLKEKLKKANIGIITIRQNKYLKVN